MAGHALLIKVMQLDLADLDSVARFARNVKAELKGKKLNILASLEKFNAIKHYSVMTANPMGSVGTQELLSLC